MSLLDLLSHYPTSTEQRAGWYKQLTSGLNAQNVSQLHFDGVQPCGSSTEQLNAIECCTTALHHARNSAQTVEVVSRVLAHTARITSEAVPFKADPLVQTAVLHLATEGTALALHCLAAQSAHERALTKQILDALMPLMEQQWLVGVSSAHHADLLQLCGCAVELSNRNIGTSAVMTVTWKLIKWCLKETQRAFVQAPQVFDALLTALCTLLHGGLKRYTALAAAPGTDPRVLLAVDKSLKFLYPCLVLIARSYPDLLFNHVTALRELSALIVPHSSTADARQYCYKGVVSIARQLLTSGHVTAVQREHVIRTLLLPADSMQLLIDLLPELVQCVSDTDWPVQVLTRVIQHVALHTLGAEATEISSSPNPTASQTPTPSPTRADMPVIQQSVQLLSHVLAAGSAATCRAVKELIVSHVLDTDWHVSLLALHWWCLLLDTHREHAEPLLHVLHALLERHRQWTRFDTCQTAPLVTSLFETRLCTLLLHTLLHLGPAEQRRVVAWLEAPLRAQLSTTPLGLALAPLLAPHAANLPALVRAVQQALAEVTRSPLPEPCTRLIDSLSQLVTALCHTSEGHTELLALLLRVFEGYAALPATDTRHWGSHVMRLASFMAIKLQLDRSSGPLAQVLALMTHITAHGHDGALHFAAFVALCLRQSTVPVPQCAALIAALLDARLNSWPTRLATLLALADVAALMPAPELLEALLVPAELNHLLAFLDHALAAPPDLAARVTAVTRVINELRQSLAARVVPAAADPEAQLIQRALQHVELVQCDLSAMAQQWTSERALQDSVRTVQQLLREFETSLKRTL